MAAKSFIKFFEEINSGTFNYDISNALNDLMAEIEDKNGPGAITITLKFKKVHYENAGSVIEVDPKYDIKKPKKSHKSATFFVSPDNNLIKESPHQMTMFPKPGEDLTYNADGEIVRTTNV